MHRPRCSLERYAFQAPIQRDIQEASQKQEKHIQEGMRLFIDITEEKHETLRREDMQRLQTLEQFMHYRVAQSIEGTRPIPEDEILLINTGIIALESFFLDGRFIHIGPADAPILQSLTHIASLFARMKKKLPERKDMTDFHMQKFLRQLYDREFEQFILLYHTLHTEKKTNKKKQTDIPSAVRRSRTWLQGQVIPLYTLKQGLIAHHFLQKKDFTDLLDQGDYQLRKQGSRFQFEPVYHYNFDKRKIVSPRENRDGMIHPRDGKHRQGHPHIVFAPMPAIAMYVEYQRFQQTGELRV